MREDIDKIYAALREEVSSQRLVDRLVRAVRQEKAAAQIDALMETKEPTIEALSDHLEFEMASCLQNALDSGELNPSSFVSDNRSTLKLIARGAAVSFQKLNA